MADNLKVNNKCSECEKRYKLNKDNALLHWYKKRSYCANVEMECPHCGWVEYLFIDESWQAEAFATDWPRKVNEDAEPWLLEAWEEVFGKLRQYVELPQRLEGEINDLSVLLAATPDEWLMEIFKSPPPKSARPKDWL